MLIFFTAATMQHHQLQVKTTDAVKFQDYEYGLNPLKTGGMNMNEKKYVVTSDLVFAIFISLSNCIFII